MTSSDDASLDEELLQTVPSPLNETDVIDTIERLNKFLDRPNLSLEQKHNIHLHRAQAYQRRGEHHVALEILAHIDVTQSSKQDLTDVLKKYCTAVSYSALGSYSEACNIFHNALPKIHLLMTDPTEKARMLLEGGKAFYNCSNYKMAKKCWKKAVKLFEINKDDVLHYARAQANLGNLLLKSLDESKQEEGIELLRRSSSIKQDIGDISGLATNYSMLGLYYWRNGRYERALAFLRMDLHLSYKAGNLQDISATLCNLAQLYIMLKQPSLARQRTKGARQIGEFLKDQHQIKLVDDIDKRISDMAKEVHLRGEKLGSQATCRCGSGKEFQDCCGRADFEPSDSTSHFGRLLDHLRPLPKDIQQIVDDIQRIGKEPTQLDILLRQTEEVKLRQGWNWWEVNDGWIRIIELPDMANYYLNAAKSLAEEAQSEPTDAYTKPLSCVILSVCALEAFINQVSFFLNEIQASPQSRFYRIPSELTGDVTVFQRTTELKRKWEIVGKALCGNKWSPPDSLVTDFRNLVTVRNELVHYKSSKSEQVEPPPPPNQQHEIMRYVPDSVETRQISRSWPARLLTFSYATHCVHVAESMIDYFKKSYKEDRLDTAGDYKDEDAIP